MDPGELDRVVMPLTAAYDRLDSAVMILDPAGVIAYANPAAAALFGLEPAQLVGVVASSEGADVRTADDKLVTDAEAAGLTAVRTGQPQAPRLYGVPRPGGGRRWLRVHAVPFDALGQGYVLETAVDVTVEREALAKAAATHEASAQLHASVLQAMSEGVMLFDPRGRPMFANAAAQRILGIPIEQLLSGVGADSPHWTLFGADGRPLPADQAPSEITRRTGLPCGPVELAIQRVGGPLKWLSSAAVPVPGPNGELAGVVGTFVDLTARKRERTELDAANAALASIVPSIPGVIYRFELLPDGTQRIPMAVGRVRELIGLDVDELPNGLGPLFERVHPEDLPTLHAAILEAATRRGDFACDFRVQNGDSFRWVRVRSAADPGDDPVLRYTGVVVDIHEERRLAEALGRRQRREAMSELAAGLAHNFNNVLAGVLATLEHARDEAASGIPASLDESIRAVRRAAALVRQLLHVARGDATGRPEAVDFGAIVAEVGAVCQRTFDAGITVEVRVDAQNAWVFGDPAHLHQVALDLCINARDALEGRAERRLSIELVDRPGPVPGGPQVDAPTHLELVVRDNGRGMSAEALRRLGEPFYTTKPSGTGLGIASVMGTLRDIGGAFEAHSTEGLGTVMTARLPRTPRPAEPVAAGPVVPDKLGCVLVVDDDRFVRTAVTRLIAKAATRVDVADDGREAIAKIDAAPDAYDAVVLDLAMAGLDGAATLAILRVSHPNLPVIILSGDSAARGPLEGATAVLDKPIDRARLLEALRDAARKGPRAPIG